jgi:transcriptional regulator with XRE-family HTH domain
MSSEALGTRLGMSAQGVRKLEQAEADGSISLKTLFRLADGLDCDVQYMLVPRTSLVEQVLKRTHEVAGIPMPPLPQIADALREQETLQALSTMLGLVNKRGLW